ncbi:MAG: Bax inhibitor-1/YccA family protein [Acidimicrobiales bacterium]|nr:Bax inhibitor-1/YccA family protein [Acidimicrobiales bacterium]
MAISNPVLNESRWREAIGGVGYTMPTERPRTMTLQGTAFATGVLFLLVSVAAAWGYQQVDQTFTTEFVPGEGSVVVSTARLPTWLPLAVIAGLVLALITAFVPKAARFTAPAYALSYGAAVGAISAFYNIASNGIVFQAVLATFATFGVMYVLYVTRIIRATRRFIVVIVAATGGIFVMYLVGFIASVFGADWAFWNDPTPLGIGISVVICAVAALNLVLDFAFIESATEAGAPKYMEWYGAFGLTVTMIWLYLEILRLLSLLNRR